MITQKSAVSCIFQHSKCCNIRYCMSERFRSFLRHKPKPPTERPSQPFTQPSLLQSKLTSSSSCSAEQRTGERHKHGMGQPVWHKAPHLTVAEQKAETGRSSPCMCVYACACVCMCVCMDVLVSMLFLCGSCLQSFSVICLHLHFLSPHCSSALWLSQREAESHCAGFIP